MSQIIEDLKDLHFTLSNLEDYVRRSDEEFVDTKKEDMHKVRATMELIESIIKTLK